MFEVQARRLTVCQGIVSDVVAWRVREVEEQRCDASGFVGVTSVLGCSETLEGDGDSYED